MWMSSKIYSIFLLFQYDSYQNEMEYNNNGSNRIDPRPPPQYLQPQAAMMEDAASGPSPRDRAFENNRPSPPPAQNRPQARVPPTPVYRPPPRGGPVPSPPNQTPQRPHAIRQQQPLPPSQSRGPPHPPQPREPTPPSTRESPPLSSKSEITGDFFYHESRETCPSLNLY